MWDVRYATTARTVTPTEQHIHSFLEMIPLMAIIGVVSIHWQQFLALFGAGGEAPRFDIAWKPQSLPVAYIFVTFAVILIFEFLPYIEEFVRGYRRNGGRLVPPLAQNGRPGLTTER
jgi:hypothetical protein